MGQIAEARGVPAPGGDESRIVREVSAPLFEAKGWMKLLGVLLIIYGIFVALTIVGIVICWLPIWLGASLLRAAGATEMAQVGGDRLQLITAMSKLRTFFTIQGVLALIGLIALGVFLFAGGMASIMSIVAGS